MLAADSLVFDLFLLIALTSMSCSVLVNLEFIEQLGFSFRGQGGPR